MTFGTQTNPRDILKVRFQFSGQEPKIRPALVISNSYVIQNTNFMVLVPITRLDGQKSFNIPITTSDFESGTLPYYPSYVVCNVIMTFEPRERIGYYGRVNKQFFKKIIDMIENQVFEQISTGSTKSTIP